MRKIIFLFITFCSIDLSAQNNIQRGLEYWKDGNIEKALDFTTRFLEQTPENDVAILLKLKVLYVKGKYEETIKFAQGKTLFNKFPEAVTLVTNTYLHLGKYKEALEFAETYKSERTGYLKEIADRPFTVIADKTAIIPFANDTSFMGNMIPVTQMRINGTEKTVMFDTGAEYFIIGINIANELGLKLEHPAIGQHAASDTKIWHTVTDSLSFVNGPVFLNVPTIIMEDSPDLMIWGTNILEQFLSTIDYPNRRFILTPRKMKSLYKAHFDLLPSQQKILPFFLWGSHYMFAKGRFAEHDSLNFFFDSGLCAVGNINGELKQASFTASKETLLKWGFGIDKLRGNNFLVTTGALGITGLAQPNTLIWYDKNLEKDRTFGGVRIDGLISHAWLKKYVWTINFENREYIFGIVDQPQNFSD